jgi:hypothetical protein
MIHLPMDVDRNPLLAGPVGGMTPGCPVRYSGRANGNEERRGLHGRRTAPPESEFHGCVETIARATGYVPAVRKRMRERKPIDRALRRFLDEEAAPSRDLAQMTDEALAPRKK